MKARFSLLLILVLVFNNTMFANFVYIPHSAPAYKEHEGYIVTNSNDTVYGLLTMGQYKGLKRGVRIKSGSQKRFIFNTDIVRIRVFARDSTVIKTSYTDFAMFENSPWRVIATDKVEVYDKVLYTDERPGRQGEEISILVNGKMVSSFNFWGLSKKKDLVSFVNKRYHKQFSLQDFKTSGDIVLYVAANG